MKQLTSLILLLVVAFAKAQPSSVVSAKMDFQSGNYEKAIERIEKATVHPKTKEDPKTWKYRGDIYYGIYTSTESRVKNLDEAALNKSFESYKMLDKFEYDKYKKEASNNVKMLHYFALNDGVNRYNKNDFVGAYKCFETTIEIADYRGGVDSLAYLNCGLAADKMGKEDLAISWYEKCVELGYQPEKCATFIIYSLKSSGKKEEADRKVDEYLKVFPKSSLLMSFKINDYLEEGNYQDAKEMIVNTLKDDPSNYVLHYTLGTINDGFGDAEAAEKNYLNALKYNENYFDANYNLGAFYFNKGVEYNNLSLDHEGTPKGEELLKKANDEFLKAQKYLEKAHELKSDEIATLQSLKQLYIRNNEIEKYQEVKLKLKNLGY